MTRKALLALIAGLLQVGVALANAGPAPLPKDHKVVEPPVKFEGIDAHKDRVFVLHYGAIYFDYTLVEVKDEKAFNLDFKAKSRAPQSPYLELYAVDRTEFERRKKDDPKLKWLTEEKPGSGVLRVKLDPPPATLPTTLKDVPLTTYRVAIQDGKLTAEKVVEKKADPKGPLLAFGLAASLSLAWLGLWYARRGGNRLAG